MGLHCSIESPSLALVLLAALVASTTAFYRPSFVPTAYHVGARRHWIAHSRIRYTSLEVSDKRKGYTFSKQAKSTGRGANGSTAASKKRQKKPDLRTQLEYARNGHAVMRGLLDPFELEPLRGELWEYGMKKELHAWRQKVEVAADSAKLAASCRTVQDCRKELSRLGVPDDSLPFLQYFNSWTSQPSVYDVVLKLAETAAILMDVESVRLYQDSLFWKRPGDGPTPWHTDARMAPFDTSHLVTLWIPLQPVLHDGTGLVFCSKSHADFALPFWNAVNQTETNPKSPWNSLDKRYQVVNDAQLVDYMPLSTGDVTAHAGWTLHCADGNLESDRLALAITYVDAQAVVREDAVSSAVGDNEDVWSYRDWVNEVPARTRGFRHARVPIVWPRKGSIKQ